MIGRALTAPVQGHRDFAGVFPHLAKQAMPIWWRRRVPRGGVDTGWCRSAGSTRIVELRRVLQQGNRRA
jgi:hypothetical protein